MNAATRINDVLVRDWSVGHLTTECFADDFVREDRRRLIAMPDSNLEGHRKVIADVLEFGGRFLPHQPVAVRGDRFSLARFDIAYEEGRSLVRYLIVTALDESAERIERTVLFDDDNFDEAYETLDRLWLDDTLA